MSSGDRRLALTDARKVLKRDLSAQEVLHWIGSLIAGLSSLGFAAPGQTREMPAASPAR
jgi:hypothetical protein